MAIEFKHTELFGGAITASIPSNFVDVSKMRQVPDNQEVFVDADGFASLTFDIMERVSHLSTDSEALEYHFADIVGADDSKEVTSVVENLKLPSFPLNTPILSLTATTTPKLQTTKPKPLNATKTDIYLALIRLLDQSTDIVLTFNLPHLSGETSVDGQSKMEAGISQQKVARETETLWHQIVTSFEIKDWGLFGSE